MNMCARAELSSNNIYAELVRKLTCKPPPPIIFTRCSTVVVISLGTPLYTIIKTSIYR